MSPSSYAQDKKPRKPGIPTASMGDIAFLIIIFFMVTSVFSRDKGLKMVLPADSTRIPRSNLLPVLVNEEGMVRVGADSVPVSVHEVRGLVSGKLRQNPDMAIALRVSRRAPYHVMIEVFDQLKLAKAPRISLVPVQDKKGG